MNKFFCLIFCFLTSTLFADEPDTQLIEKCLKPTVFIHSGNSSGTGVIISSKKIELSENEAIYVNVVLTCNHIIDEQFLPDPAYAAPNKLFSGKYDEKTNLTGIKEFDFAVTFSDKDKDIAILEFPSLEEMPFADIEKEPKIYVGNELLKIGCGQSDTFRLDYGRITSLSGSISMNPKFSNVHRTSLFTLPGDSGGPVFNKYKLIGLCNALAIDRHGPYSNPINNVSYVTPIESFFQNEEAKKRIEE